MTKPNFWRAFAAYTIDFIGMRVIIVPLTLFVILGLMMRISPNIFVGEIVGWIFLALYFALLERKTGASLGKMWMKMKVFPNSGKTLSFGRLFVAYLIDGIFAIFFMLMAGYMTAKFLSFPLHIAGTIFPVLQTLFGIIGFVTFAFWYIFYYAYSECKWGYSIGKQIMGLHVEMNR